MGSFRVEFIEKIIEPGLLSQAVLASGPGCFFLQGEVHAFVAAVLLRMPGLDALDADAESEPEDGKP